MANNNELKQPKGTFRPQWPQKVIVDSNDLSTLAPEIDLLGAERVLVITSPSVATRTPLLEQVKNILGDRLKGHFQECAPHTPIPLILKAARLAREVSADCLISLGGGSVIDSTKAVAFVIDLDIDSTEELEPHLGQFSGGQLPPLPSLKNPLPHITIPTTGGAAELTGMVGVTDPVAERKFLIVAPELTPKVAILDASVTQHTPPSLWLSTLVRSVDHAVEACYSKMGNPHTDILAAEGARLMFKYLPKCYESPDDLQVRGSLQVAAWHSGWAVIGAGAGLSHGIGYILGGTYDVPHGFCSCIMLPAVMEWNMETSVVPLARLARIIGAAGDDDDDKTAALKSVTAVRDLVASLGLPTRLSELDPKMVTQADFDKIAEMTMEMPHVITNPRLAKGKEDIIELMNLAW